MKTTAIVVIVSLITLGATSAFAQDLSAVAAPAAKVEAADWRKVAEAIPLGSKVKVDVADGKRVTGTLVRTDAASLVVRRNTRLPEAAVVVPFDRVSNLQRDHGGGMSIGKAIGIGVGAGAGAMLTIILFALQLD